MPNIVVTGANRGLGLAIVRLFAREKWHVIAACRDTGNFPQKYLSDNISVAWVDVASDSSRQHFVKLVTNQMSSLDVLINNAGVYDNDQDRAPVFSDIERITPVFQINAMAPRLISDDLSGVLTKSELKTVVTISSYMGSHEHIDAFDAEHWPYSASKAAVDYAMDAYGFLHPDLKSYIISPGWMKTRLGGDDAPIHPDDVATKIYELVLNPERYDSRRLLEIYQDEDKRYLGW